MTEGDWWFLGRKKQCLFHISREQGIYFTSGDRYPYRGGNTYTHTHPRPRTLYEQLGEQNHRHPNNPKWTRHHLSPTQLPGRCNHVEPAAAATASAAPGAATTATAESLGTSPSCSGTGCLIPLLPDHLTARLEVLAPAQLGSGHRVGSGRARFRRRRRLLPLQFGERLPQLDCADHAGHVQVRWSQSQKHPHLKNILGKQILATCTCSTGGI